MLTNRASVNQLALLLLSLVCAAAMWSYWDHLTRDVIDGVLETSSVKPKALTDLYPRWYGARELLLHHRDPYGIEVSHELQIAFYGRLLDPSRPGEPRDQERFAYPLYVVFLLAPFVHMDFHTVCAIFWWLLAAVTIGSAALWQRFFGLSLSWAGFGTLTAMILGSIGGIQGLNVLQLGLLVSCFIAAAAVCTISGQLFLAGAFLALSTIKPQLAALPVVWFGLWATAGWRRRRSLVGGLAATMGALIIGSEYLLPGWLWRYPDALRSYAGYSVSRSLLGVLFRSPLHWLLAILAFFIAAGFWWHSRWQAAQSVSFAISLGFALTLTVSIVPAVTSPFNQVLLLPVVLLLICHWNELWRANTLTRFTVVMFCGWALLPWLLALGITLTPSSMQQSWPLYLWFAPLSASLALPFAAFSLLIPMRRLARSSSSPNRSASPSGAIADTSVTATPGLCRETKFHQNWNRIADCCVRKLIPASLELRARCREGEVTVTDMRNSGKGLDLRQALRPCVLPPVKHLALLLLVLVGSSSMCLYWHRYNEAVLAALESRSGLKPKPLTDLYPSWYGTREVLLHHRDPYGADVNRELQIAFYGKELDPSRPEERMNQQRFVYPPYFIFFMAPLCWMQFHAAQTGFWWILVACASFQLLLWLRFLRLKLSQIALVALFVLVLTSIPVIQNLSILQPFLLAACFLAGAAVAVAGGRLFLTGALLALATVKPQICLLATAWFALWACSDWRQRRTLLLGFTTTLTVLLLASEWLLPGWWREYPGVLRDYAKYTKASTFLATLFPNSALHWLVTLLALTTMAVFCWSVRRMPPNSTGFAIALSLVLTLTVCVVPAMVQPFNHVLLLPTVLLTIRHWKELRQGNFVVRAGTSVFCVCAFLPWLFAAVAIANPFSPHSSWLLKMWSVPLAASMAVPFAAFGVLLLLWRAIPLHATGPYGIDGSTVPHLGTTDLRLS